MSNCPICDKHHSNLSTVLYETEHWIITYGQYDSQILGYLYLEPKRHIENWSDFRDEELLEIGLIIKKVEGTLRELISIDRLYTVTISEAVRHIHFHLIPRLNEETVRGLDLIQQATTQTVKTSVRISEEDHHAFVNKLKMSLK